jgi:hypothetical protein
MMSEACGCLAIVLFVLLASVDIFGCLNFCLFGRPILDESCSTELP